MTWSAEEGEGGVEESTMQMHGAFRYFSAVAI